MTIDEKASEAAAKAVFECHCFNPDKHPWVKGGNSFKQQDARRIAVAAIEAGRAALPPTADVGELVGKLRDGVDHWGDQETDDGVIELFNIEDANDTMAKAADALTAQAARIAELEQERDEAKAEVRRIHREKCDLFDARVAATDRAEKAEAAAREALKEISELPDSMAGATPSDYARGFMGGRYRAQMIARAALEEK